MTPSSPRCAHMSLVSLRDIHDMVHLATSTLSHDFQELALQLTVQVENFPCDNTLANLNITNKYDLLGLYRGIPLRDQKEHHVMQDTIFIYRCPLIRYAHENNELLPDLVRYVFLYEMAHHLHLDSQKFVDAMNTNTKRASKDK